MPRRFASSVRVASLPPRGSGVGSNSLLQLVGGGPLPPTLDLDRMECDDNDDGCSNMTHLEITMCWDDSRLWRVPTNPSLVYALLQELMAP